MGNHCGLERKKGLHSHKRMNTDPNSRTNKRAINSHTNCQETNSTFKFMLTDDDLLISPSSITENDPSHSITSPATDTTAHHNMINTRKFTFDNVDGENPLDLWVRQLTNSSCPYSEKDYNLKQQWPTLDTIHSVPSSDDIEPITSDTSSNSSASDEENNKAHLYRPGTISKWDTTDIDEKQKEMMEQLNYLELDIQERTPTNDNDNYSIKHVHSHTYTHTPSKSKSKLILTLSQSYDSDDMENEENQMKKHLLHLRNSHLGLLDIGSNSARDEVHDNV